MGTDYPTADGTAIRDYIHVADLANAHMLALKGLENRSLNDVINLGSGRGSSVQQVVDMVATVTGRAVRCDRSARRPGDPAELVANPAKAESVLAWKPKRSTLELVVGDAWAWFQSRGYADLPTDRID